MFRHIFAISPPPALCLPPPASHILLWAVVDMKHELAQVKKSCSLNLASCYLKTQQHDLVVEESSAVLQSERRVRGRERQSDRDRDRDRDRETERELHRKWRVRMRQTQTDTDRQRRSDRKTERQREREGERESSAVLQRKRRPCSTLTNALLLGS